MSSVHTLPHWDMSVVYPGLESQEFAQGFASVIQDIHDLAQLFDTYHIMEQTSTPLSNDIIKAFETVIERYNVVLDAIGTLGAYIMCFVATNTSDNLAHEADRDVRRRAYDAELAAWKRMAVPLAAALNSIKGEVNTLVKRRNWESPLEASLFDSGIDRQTLDAMLAAARESFPDFRRYLQAKARVLGLARLAWYDLFAPVGKDERVWEYDEAASFIIEQFGTFSSRLSNFAARAFREQWIDAEPRAGKVDGAFCAPLRRDESRVLANYKPSYDGMSTLAHELGHGYHNLNLAQRTALQRDEPMTLAETASIFCETIIRHAALPRAGTQEQIDRLEASLQGSCQVGVDITSRFLFE